MAIKNSFYLITILFIGVLGSAQTAISGFDQEYSRRDTPIWALPYNKKSQAERSIERRVQIITLIKQQEELREKLFGSAINPEDADRFAKKKEILGQLLADLDKDLAWGDAARKAYIEEQIDSYERWLDEIDEDDEGLTTEDNREIAWMKRTLADLRRDEAIDPKLRKDKNLRLIAEYEEMIKKIPGQKELNPDGRQKKEAMDKMINDLYLELASDGFKSDSKYGRAIASGLAGKDWAALQDEQINDVWEGAKLGGLIRVSRACSDVLGKRIENSIDRVLGGTWDTIISAIVDSWNSVCEVLFHGGSEPFAIREIKSWQDQVKGNLEGIGRLLKDGLKDSLRGHDMTLRHLQGDQDVEQEDDNAPSYWKIVIGGYIRQFDDMVGELESRLMYYNGDEKITKCVNEIKHQILGVNSLLQYTQSLKDLDTLLDSNKTIIPELQKNILSLFVRLADLIEPPSSSSRQSNSAAGSSDSSRKGMGRSSFEEDGMPRPFARY